MGVDWYATAAIGVKVEGGSLYQEVEVFDEEHAARHGVARDVQYCSRCGRKMYERDSQPIEGFDPDEVKFLGFDVVFCTDGNYAVIGLSGISTNSYRQPDGDEIAGPVSLTGSTVDKLYQDLLAALRPLGLWGEFGLWSVLYCSY